MEHEAESSHTYFTVTMRRLLNRKYNTEIITRVEASPHMLAF